MRLLTSAKRRFDAQHACDRFYEYLQPSDTHGYCYHIYKQYHAKFSQNSLLNLVSPLSKGGLRGVKPGSQNNSDLCEHRSFPTKGGNWGVRSNLGVNDVIFPLFLRLSDLAEAEGEIINAIPRIIERDYPKAAKSIKYLLEDKLKNNKCLLLLDALDEVPQEYRPRLKERLNRFLKNYDCSIICTSRIVGYGGAFVDSAKEVEIVPFSQKQTEAYIQIWFKNAAGYIEDDSVSAEGLIAEIQKKPQIAGLAQNPLLFVDRSVV